MKYVKHMRVKPGMSVGQLVEEMGSCGVLGAGRLAKAVNVLTEMFEDPDYTVFLAIAGPMIPGGLRKIISDLINQECVNVIVTNGANVVHDVIEALGYRHIRGTFLADDEALRKEKLGRIGDVYVEQKAFEALEKRLHEIFENLSEDEGHVLSIREILFEIGKRLDDTESMLVNASKLNIPIFSPGLFDSMIGLHIWTFSQIKKLRIDPVLDLKELANIVFEAKKVGAIILGGGLPKHHVLGANILREGVDAAVQVTLDRPEGGSLSGAPLEEAISWKKAKSEGKLVTVVGDATIIFPIMIAATLEKITFDPC